MRRCDPLSLVASLLLTAFTFFCSSEGVAAEPDRAHPFLTRYCLDCHSQTYPAGEREFDTLDLSDSGFDTQRRLQEIIDALTLETMPPEDGEQPTGKQRLAAINEFTQLLTRMREQSKSSGGQTVLRRLSRREYRNTIADLLNIDLSMFDPTLEFPDDDLSDGFDNVGQDLITSGFLLEKYLDAAEASVEKAFAGQNLQQSQQWRFNDNFRQQQELSISHRVAFKYRYLVLYDHPRNEKPEGAYGHISDFPRGVPADGLYKIRVLAEGLHRDTPYVPKAVFIDPEEPFRLGIRPGDTRLGDMAHTQPLEPLLAETTVVDNELKWYEFTVPLDRRFAPRFTFENGQHDVRGSYARVYRLHRNLLPEHTRNARGIVECRNALMTYGQLPQIRIHEVQIEGPLPTSPQKDIYEALVGGSQFQQNRLPELFRQFATRAFRRPVKAAEVERLIALYKARIGDGRSPEQAYQDGLKAILCSPEFLYFSPPESAERDRLDDFALAERLAYFLTSTLPDERLTRLAGEGKLKQPEVLRAEAARLLDDPRSDRFIADFLDNWLKLRSLGSMPPDPRQFREYYSAGLKPEMKQETGLFVRDLIQRNASVLELLNAKHSFVNRDLAKLYGVENQVPVDRAEEFHRVVFTNPNRGGLLGQASVLTVSANGIETSPVVRGVWLLENILGTPTPPPPDDVPAIEPDIRGATTIRDQLDKHRQLASCNQCHRKIDPLGFALEGFDPIGRSRTFYDSRRKQRIDTSGVLPGGKEFSGPAELKERLLEQQDFFVRTVTDRLLTHALGRHPEAVDRAEIEQIVASVRDDEYPLQDLILAVVSSELFLHR